MESLVADHKPMLDLVLMSFSLLLKHYVNSEQQLQEINGKLTAIGMKNIEQEATSNSLFTAMFQPQRGVGGNGDEVNQYLLIDVIQSSGFINVLSWWSARKESLLSHYQMAMDYHGMPTTSTPSKRVNSATGREFTCTR
ncbi:unnamed protein product [Sphagnum jensenii]|uniref:HAT C-terminal dimerisation domain-containing protein n=1 Tax=Sphagnum jensenii TaxID=128206 RepID=A0ABP1B3P9_9BRYO